MNVEVDKGRLDAWAEALGSQGYLVDAPLPDRLLADLQARAATVNYRPAEVGRQHKRLDPNIRGDEIAWVSSSDPIDAAWMRWLDNLQQGLNRRLFLGLQQHESHYAHYPSGASYQRHRDAFAASGQSNRIVSLVLYLNETWSESWGGELVLYPKDKQVLLPLEHLSPIPGRLVMFMSEDFPHEVLAGRQNRYSLAAWFRGSSPNSAPI